MHSVGPPPKDPLTEPGPWNAVAAGYDEVCFEQLPELTDAAIELLAAEPDDTVLDVATGPGTLAVRLAPRVRRVVAVDFAEVMLERLRRHIMRHHLSNVEARVMNGEALDFENGTFAAAISLFGVFSFDDRERGLNELLRVVVPGGRVLSSSWATPDENTLLGAGMAALYAALPDLPQPKGPLPTQIPQLCAREFDKIGFDDVSTQLFEKSIKFESVDAYWQTFELAAAPVGLLRKQLGEAAFGDASVRVRAELRARFGDGPFAVDCAAILTLGEVPRSAA